ncbi:unnamed protein product [Dicrocoelium dendriticum]|nr:unnamed protein product [Dicrocoelium dendriticum]
MSELGTVPRTPDKITKHLEKSQTNVQKTSTSKVDTRRIALDIDNLTTLSTSSKAFFSYSTDTLFTQGTGKAGSPIPDNNTPITSNSSCTRIKGKFKCLEQWSNDN